jgi:predicted metal-dependent HD superfamily phosphohydrolase
MDILINLKQQFDQLLNHNLRNSSLFQNLWTELEQLHSEKHRHYHHFGHLNHLLSELKAIQNQIENWDAVLFALFYHDSIYNPSASDNEEKSAELAEKRMRELNCPNELIALTIEIILATKSHHNHSNQDINLFTDADLAILGSDSESYKIYAKNIRKEYKIYPSIIYKTGRKKVLLHFLKMERLFKTDYFFNKYEEKARINIEQEFKSL